MAELKKILLVDDNENDVELTLEALSSNNLNQEVQVLHDGAEALDYLFFRGSYANRPEGFFPSIMLLDLKMPKVNGLEVLRQIKGNSKLRSMPVVILTASREERDLIESYELGVNAFVVKPSGFTQFIKAIKEIGAFWASLNEPPPGHRKKKI